MGSGDANCHFSHRNSLYKLIIDYFCYYVVVVGVVVVVVIIGGIYAMNPLRDHEIKLDAFGTCSRCLPIICLSV